MGKPSGFKDYARENPGTLSPRERVKHSREFTIQLPEMLLVKQGARCMDCGVPFCHTGCPLGNVIPDFNDAVYRGDWEKATEILLSTNNFPEFTGRICPAPCEESCVLGINEPAVTIKNIERAIADRIPQAALFPAEARRSKTGKVVAIVGSGPSGLACSEQLLCAGHDVRLFERCDKAGGLLRYGIPDFKLEKRIVEKRIDMMQRFGLELKTGIDVGRDVSLATLLSEHDAVVLCIGASRPRDLAIPGRELDGIYFAMEFLAQQNRRVAGDDALPPEGSWWFGEDRREISAFGKDVIVVGGGDTGSDCVGTCIRQGAASVTQFELLEKPPRTRPKEQPWPYWPNRLRTTSSHEEGCDREWSILTKRLCGDGGSLTSLETVYVAWKRDSRGKRVMEEIEGTERTWKADMLLLALGFLGPEVEELGSDSGIELDSRGVVSASALDYAVGPSGLFACGDARRGQSLVVWAIIEGREAARAVDAYLMGDSSLPTKGEGDLPRV